VEGKDKCVCVVVGGVTRMLATPVQCVYIYWRPLCAMCIYILCVYCVYCVCTVYTVCVLCILCVYCVYCEIVLSP
jgi:hypothetical protein